MASRPVFLPSENENVLVEERSFNFQWASGFAEVQKKKNIDALHKKALESGLSRVLEISSKSDLEIGKRLSTFSLKIELERGFFPLESVYQGSKVFEFGGPFPETFEYSPREAKRFIREGEFGQLRMFSLEKYDYPLFPKNAFYDWLYIRALSDHSTWIENNVRFDAYSDIEFNPAKQVNCQARAFAEFVSLSNRKEVDRVKNDFDYFVSLLSPI